MRTMMKLCALVLTLSFAATASACGDPVRDIQAEASAASASAQASPAPVAETPAPAPVPVYKDGTYEITTDKDFEGYFVKATLTIMDGKVSDFHYDIYDSNNGNVLFDENYEDYMPSQDYKQQCRDDLKGMKTYGPRLVETQSVDDVDVVSKATWTWKWFKKAAQELIDQATVK